VRGGQPLTRLDVVRGRFRLTPGGRHPHEPWFHIGTLEVTTTWLIVLLSIAGLIASAVVGAGSFGYIGGPHSLEFNLTAAKVTVVDDLRIWTLLTWPFAYWGVSLWDAVAIFLFWYFGTDVERSILGKKRFAWMLAIWTVLLGAVFVGLDSLAGTGAQLSGLSMLELMVILVWIAEWPSRMFFFNIPAWVFGLVIVGIQVLSYLGSRNWTLLVTFLIGIVVCGFVARQFGLLSEYAWIPKLGTPRRRPRRPAKRDFDPGRPTVVSGPWTPPSTPPTPPPSRDEQRMDELLDKIHESGTASLTEAEQAELRELSERRRRQS